MIEPAADRMHVQQIVPRTFSRSRVIEYVCAVDDSHAMEALDAARLRAQVDKSACETLQQRRQAGEGRTRRPSRASIVQCTRFTRNRRGSTR